MSIENDLMNAATADLLEQFLELEKHVQSFPDQLKENLLDVKNAIEILPSNIDSKLKIKMESIFELIEEALKSIDSNKDEALKGLQVQIAVLEKTFIKNISNDTSKALEPTISKLTKLTEDVTNKISSVPIQNNKSTLYTTSYIAFFTFFLGVALSLSVIMIVKPQHQDDNYKEIFTSFLIAQENAINATSKQCAIEFKTNFDKQVNKK